MKHAYLEVTYRKGRPVAAYYYLPRRTGDTSKRTQRMAAGLLVDFEPGGRAIGIEISSPSRLDLAQLNNVLAQLGQPAAAREDLTPLMAA